MDTMRSEERSSLVKVLIRGFLGLNVIILLTALVFAVTSVRSVVLAAPVAQGTTQKAALDGMVALAAAVSTGLATIGAGMAVGMTGSAALGTIAERPEFFGRALIFVGLAEGIAIYGLIVSFLILTS